MGMKHLLTTIKHELHDYLRAWEQSHPDLLEMGIRLVFCVLTGAAIGFIIGLVAWSAAIGFGAAVTAAIVLMLFMPSEF